MFNVLVVEDDNDMRELLNDVFIGSGYNCFSCANGLEAFEIIEKEFINLVVTDVMMPKMDGYEFSKALRKAGYEIPILMITAKDSFENLEKGFKCGADDYMTKPINFKELLLRTEALLRRAKINTEKKITVGETTLDFDSLCVRVKSDEQTLPQKEFYLLFKLLSKLNKIHTRQEIIDEIWGMNVEVDDKTVNTHINRLRNRFSKNSDFEIVTVRGLGYKAVKKC